MKTKVDLLNNVVSEVELHYKNKVKPSIKIDEAVKAYNIFKSIDKMNNNIELKEMFYVMYLNRANKVQAVMLISEGSSTGTVVDIKFVLKGAIDLNSSGCIICHNHPSFQIVPSKEDNNITEKIKKACDLFDIKLLDHLIITDTDFYSYANQSDIL